MLGARAAEVPAATVLVDGYAIGQRQVVVDIEIAVDIEVAAKGHAVQRAVAVVVVGGQRRTIRAHQRAALDGADQCSGTGQRGGSTTVVD